MNVSELPFNIRHCVAPMVGQSDLAYRLLLRELYQEKWKSSLCCYTEMIRADRFVEDEEYRLKYFQTHAEDRPLVIQFCGNAPSTLSNACKLVKVSECDAIDLNLGCPQDRAYQDHYGSFLLDKTDWPLVSSIVESMAAATTLPIFCKIRLLPKLEDTIRFCQLLEKSGASLIAVHGRMRKSTKKRRDGPADLDAIREIVKHIHVPIVSNGNISTPQDVDANLQHTDAAGIMSAEAVLCNPSIFAGEDSHRCPRKTHDNLFRYLDLAEKYPPPSFKYVQDHVSNLLGRSGRGRQIQYTYRGPYKPIALKKKIFEMSTSIEDLRSLVAEVFPE